MIRKKIYRASRRQKFPKSGILWYSILVRDSAQGGSISVGLHGSAHATFSMQENPAAADGSWYGRKTRLG